MELCYHLLYFLLTHFIICLIDTYLLLLFLNAQMMMFETFELILFLIHSQVEDFQKLLVALYIVQ